MIALEEKTFSNSKACSKGSNIVNWSYVCISEKTNKISGTIKKFLEKKLYRLTSNIKPYYLIFNRNVHELRIILPI